MFPLAAPAPEPAQETAEIAAATPRTIAEPKKTFRMTETKHASEPGTSHKTGRITPLVSKCPKYG